MLHGSLLTTRPYVLPPSGLERSSHAYIVLCLPGERIGFLFSPVMIASLALAVKNTKKQRMFFRLYLRNVCFLDL